MRSKWLALLLPIAAFAQGDILSNPKPAGTIGSQVVKNLAIASGSTATLLSTVTGSGYISEFVMFSNRYQTEIIVTIDGERAPAIDLNLAELLGDDYCDTQASFNGRWISCSNPGGDGNVGGAFRLPIPFGHSITIQAKNNDSQGRRAYLAGYIIYHVGVSDAWPYTQRLHVVHTVATGLTEGTEAVMANINCPTRGRLVGFGWLYDGYHPYGNVDPIDAPLEGAFKIYLDGAVSANYATSGTEDLFGEGWYFSHFASFSGAQGNTLAPGSTDSILTIKTPVTWGGQRFFINDPITFDSGFRATWTAGNPNARRFTGAATMRSTVWYYTEN